MSAENRLIGLYTDTFGFAPAAVLPLAGAGSDRRYFRITSPDGVSAPLSVLIVPKTNRSYLLRGILHRKICRCLG